MTLTLNLKSQYFDEIKSGTKKFEYRLFEKWKNRILNKNFNEIILKRGYPKNSEKLKILKRPWRGYLIVTKQIDFFGPNSVKLFAIPVN